MFADCGPDGPAGRDAGPLLHPKRRNSPAPMSRKWTSGSLKNQFTYGEYQIGDVYARSWMLDGTSAGSFTPKNLAS